MASILNVDQINNAAGTSAVTIDASTGHATFPNGMTLPAGSVVQVAHWNVTPIVIGTGGTWAATTVPTIANTYSVGDYAFTKLYSGSKVVAMVSGHVDHSGGTSDPAIVALLESSGTFMGAAYRHVRYVNNEPLTYAFSGEDTTTGTSKTYKLRCHYNGTTMSFGRSASNNSSHVFTVVFMEIAQ